MCGERRSCDGNGRAPILVLAFLRPMTWFGCRWATLSWCSAHSASESGKRVWMPKGVAGRRFSNYCVRLNLRDFHVAHPKPRNPTLTRLKRPCSTVTRMPAVLRPTEWQSAHQLFDALKLAPIEERQDVIWEGMGLSRRSGALDKWASAPDDIASDRRWLPRKQQVRWRQF
jgi:hypothetical protein